MNITRIWFVVCLMALISGIAFAQQPAWRLAQGTEGRYFSAIAVYPRNTDTLYALGQRFFCSTDRGEHWDSVSNLSATVGAVKTDPFNSRIIYASSDGPSGNNISMSTNGGSTWQPKFIGLQCAAPFIEIDPGDQQTVYVGVGPSRIMRSSNYGQTWDTLNSPQTSCINDFKIAPSNDSLMYAAYSTGIHKSVDKGSTWTATAFPTYATMLAIHPLNPQIVYAALQSSGSEPRGVYKTTDGGTLWVQMNNGLDSLQGYDWMIRDIVVNPVSSEDIYLAVSSLRNRFLYRSTNGGSYWFSFSNGLPDSGGATTVEFDTSNHRMYVGAADWSESGIYVHDWLTSVDSRDIELANQFILYQNYPNPFNPTTTIRYYTPKRGFVALTVYDVLGRATRKLFQNIQEPGMNSILFDAEQLPSGVYFYSLSAGSSMLVRKALLMK